MIVLEGCGVVFTIEQQAELWEGWRQGEPSRLIARALRTNPAAVRTLLSRHGGVRPAERRRSRRHLSAAEWEEISRGIAAGLSARAVAVALDRPPSTISREIRRNGHRGTYRAARADAAAWERGRRPKPTRLASDPALRRLVRDKLELDWSPEQIANWLRRQTDDALGRISHETIYRTVYVASRAELGRHSSRHLRSGRSVRRVRKAKQARGRGVLRNMTSIRDRPAAVSDRIELGHWEGDLVMGRRPSAVATLVERVTRYVRIVPLPDGYKADAVRLAIADDLRQLPVHLRKTLTWDSGREMAAHQELAEELGLDVSSVIRTHPGSAARTKTRTDSFGDTSPKAQISPASPSASSTTSPAASTTGRDECSSGQPPRNSSSHTCLPHGCHKGSAYEAG